MKSRTFAAAAAYVCVGLAIFDSRGWSVFVDPCGDIAARDVWRFHEQICGDDGLVLGEWLLDEVAERHKGTTAECLHTVVLL